MGILDDLKKFDETGAAWLRDRQNRAAAAAGQPVDPNQSDFKHVWGFDVPGVTNATPPPAQSMADPPPLEVPNSEESAQDSTEGTLGSIGARGFAFPRANMATGPGVAVMGEGENYAPLGGQEEFDSIKQKADQLGEAIDAGAQAEADKSAALAQWYKGEKARQEEQQAVLRQRQLESQQELQARQQQLTEATTRYSNDLADRGQYWRNPGNIIAAFGAALMSLSSGGPELSVKMVNQAIQQDFMQRKALADMNLGELRSNLATYRQIAGDKDLGDRLAFAETNRIAAMEIDRIAQQFQGPIAKQKAAAIKTEFLRQYQLQMAQLHAAMVYNKPRLENPAILKAYQEAGNWQPYAQKAQPAGKTMGTVPAGAKAQAGGAAGPVPTTRMQAIWGGIEKPMDEETKKFIESRYPGASKQLEAERADIVRRIWSISNRNPKVFNEKMEEFERHVEADIKEIAKAASQHVADASGLRRLDTHMNVLEKVAGRLKMTPDSLISTMTNQAFGPSTVKKWKEIMGAMNAAGGNKSDNLERDLDEAVSAFRQLLAGNVNAYIKQTSGGAVSDSESERLKQVIATDHNWASIRQFVKDASARSSANLRNATNTAAHPVSGTLFLIQSGIGSPQLDTQGVKAPKKK